MPKQLQRLNFSDLIPKAESIQDGRFSFVADDALRANLALHLQYVSFLNLLAHEYDLPGGVRYSLYKTIIVFTASIVEGMLVYKLRNLVDEKAIKIENLFEGSVRYEEIKNLWQISDCEYVIGAKKIFCQPAFPNAPKFQDFIRVAKRIKLFDDALFKKADRLKILRNRIHLDGLEDVDDKYEEKDIEEAFESAKLLINRIRDFKI